MSSLAQLPAISISNTAIRQDSDNRYCLNDLHKAAGGEPKHRPNYWLENQQTIDLAKECEIAGIPAIVAKQGLGTFVVKDLVYAYGMWISPAFCLQVIRTFDAMATGQARPSLPALPALITTAQAGELATLLAERFPTGKDRPYAWSRFNRPFRLASYRDLPADRFEEACAYIPTMPVKAATPMTPLALSGPIPLPSDPARQRWLASHGERGWLLREVPANAYVLPISQWTDVIRHEPITDDDLVDLLSAVADRLSPWVRRQPVTPRA